jgi:hypothetical protein
MKPLNLDNSPCSPVSSNCVIWAGPNIPCIKLCTGDTISDVTFKLATELCTILDYLNVSNYDLSCFNLASCQPNNFQELLQFLINRICALENIEPNTVVTNGSTNIPMTAAPCFGGGTILLTDYVNQIANKICDIITELSIINASLINLQVQINVLGSEIASIVIPPSPAPINTTCVIGSLPVGSYDVDVLLDEFINNIWCGFSAIMGSTTDLITAVGAQCVTTVSTTMAFRITNPATTMGAVYGGSGFTNGTTVAEVIENLWIALCDLRAIELMEYDVTTSEDITVTTSVVGTLTTFDIGRTPKLYYYDESIVPINLVSDPAFVDLTYFMPTGYTGLTYTNTSGVTKDFLVKVSYDTVSKYDVTGSFAQPAIGNWVDGAITKNNAAAIYQVAGFTQIGAFLVDNVTNTIITPLTPEKVVTTPSGNAVTTTVGNSAIIPRNVSFFKVVSLGNAESVQLKFRAKSGNRADLLQAQFFIEEIK